MRWRLALVTTLCLCAAAPPVWFPGAGLLVIAGWAGFYALVTGPAVRRPKWTAYLVGVAHVLFFSFSLRHVLLAGYLGVGIVGGLYYVLTAVWTRALGRWLPGAVAFGCAVAGGCWLRAHFVEIQYPHVQPAHSLYHWPVLLGGLRWGGEELVNLLVAGLAAALVDAWRGWRLGRPAFGRARAVLVAVLAAWGVGLVDPGPAPVAGSRSVRLVLIEPRFPPIEHRADYVRLMRRRVIEPTLAVAGPQAAAPPDLVVWPESVRVHGMSGTSDQPVLTWPTDLWGPPFRLAPGTRLIQGSLLIGADDSLRPTALLVDERLAYVGHHEKQKIVPGGERPPFLDWLPRSVSDWIKTTFERGMGIPLPITEPGAARPLLATAAGVPFGAMICYDNAFPGPIEALSRAGAAFALVISNESWYRGGAELHQMHAMTVCRALETRLPVVRCTVDGATMVVGPDGRVAAQVPFPAESYQRGEKLAVTVPVADAPLRAVPWLRGPVTWLVLLSLLGVITPLLLSWGRLVRVGFRPDPTP